MLTFNTIKVIGSSFWGATVSVRKLLGYHKAHRLVSERTLTGLISLEHSTVLFFVCVLGPLVMLEVTLLKGRACPAKVI